MTEAISREAALALAEQKVGRDHPALAVELHHAIAALPAVTVGVRPLVWADGYRPVASPQAYQIWPDNGGSGAPDDPIETFDGFMLYSPQMMALGVHPTVEAAKAAAQADYEARILAALTTQPAPSVVPIAPCEAVAQFPKVVTAAIINQHMVRRKVGEIVQKSDPALFDPQQGFVTKEDCARYAARILAALEPQPAPDANQKGGDAHVRQLPTPSEHDTSPGVTAGATTAPDVTPEALLIAARTLRSWSEWDAAVKPAQAVVAIHSAATMLEAIATAPDALDELARLGQEWDADDVELCGKCMGSGYGGHPDSGALCADCHGKGGIIRRPAPDAQANHICEDGRSVGEWVDETVAAMFSAETEATAHMPPRVPAPDAALSSISVDDSKTLDPVAYAAGREAALREAHDAIADYPRVAPDSTEAQHYDEQIEYCQSIILAMIPKGGA